MGKIISIGWDVGGWRGNKNAFCILSFDDELEAYKKIRIEKFHLANHNELFKVDGSYPDFLEDWITNSKHDKIIFAIDAPLGFPTKFKELISGKKYNGTDGNEYKSYAFRETDIIINEGKQTLSPTFTYLTNNVTVALNMRMLLEEDGKNFMTIPFEGDDSSERKIIEVYPGIFKDSAYEKLLLDMINYFGKSSLFDGDIGSYLIEENQNKSHTQSIIEKIECIRNDYLLKYYCSHSDEPKSYYERYADLGDAFICALIGMCFELNGKEGFPKIEKEWREVIKRRNVKAEKIQGTKGDGEGWIYYPKVE